MRHPKGNYVSESPIALRNGSPKRCVILGYENLEDGKNRERYSRIFVVACLFRIDRSIDGFSIDIKEHRATFDPAGFLDP